MTSNNQDHPSSPTAPGVELVNSVGASVVESPSPDATTGLTKVEKVGIRRAKRGYKIARQDNINIRRAEKERKRRSSNKGVTVYNEEDVPTGASPNPPSTEIQIPGQTKNSNEKSKAPAELKIKDLPTVRQIHDAMPTDGIEIKELAKKFPNHIDHTNVNLFSQIVKAIGTVETKLWIKPLSQLPEQEFFDKIIQEAKRPPPPKPKLQINETIEQMLQDIAKVTFSEPEELVRGASKILPKFFYRDYENSATLSTFTSKHTHVKHRMASNLRLHEENAFQAIGNFSPTRDLTCHRIERHLRWQQKKDPSSYISAFGDIGNAVRRAQFHYSFAQGTHIGERITITAIGTADLVPITVRGRLQETIVTWTVHKDGILTWKTTSGEKVEERDVEIPCWVHKKAVPEDETPISVEQLAASGADVWLSITELRLCNLKVPATKGHHYDG
ncbi:hypothetical protein K458DRAFT_396827 [Lentithecium fluviatile CBS 122367]|uniref:Uncharacterized protein n=1 Tax=Lentithecium fluviatile CBS 122367 TaxID=1168545 RepID=A0A6G1IEQ9_9PLEO|nr:hypothetical protein K458DRAFT_396827 [Lentithecium fluviatile CBS 122367]